MQPLKTEAIRNFLRAKALPDLANLYTPDMEVQVNVARDDGEKIEKEWNGKKFSVWSDGDQEWSNFRIPKNANKDPEYNDHPIRFDLVNHAEGIGLTGWDWANRKSRYVAFDFDAIVGHSDKHTAKLSDAALEEVRQTAWDIPWVTVRKSTSGNGLHLYVFVDDVDTKNHNEHAALARAILGKMSMLTSFDFNAKVDNCGHVIWLWHRKFEKNREEGLKLLKQGIVLPIKEIPRNWQAHTEVASRKRTRVRPELIADCDLEEFEEQAGQIHRVKLDTEHKRLIDWLARNLTDKDAEWDADHHMLKCHTFDLKRAHEALGYKGIFDTKSSGNSQINCYAYPLAKGGWVVRRYTKGVAEHESWDQDASGYTRCYFNRAPDLRIASMAKGGIEDDRMAFVFQEAETAVEAAKDLGGYVTLPSKAAKRSASIRQHKEGGNRLIFEIDKNPDDKQNEFQGWVDKKTRWVKVVTTNSPTKYEPEAANHDKTIRHLVSETGGDAGWTIRADQEWKEEPLAHVGLALKALGFSAKESQLILGSSILRRWKIVNKPFQAEYLGDRIWNRDAAQFAFPPSENTDDLEFPTWQSVLAHCGKGLDDAVLKHKWCVANGIKTGGEYLMLWCASLFQKPHEHLPYLFFYSREQVTGKSTFHEALKLLMTKGYERAEAALISQSGFNGELASAVLCVVEEIDLRQNKSAAYNRLKDWVTAEYMSIHVKGSTPYSAPNYTHWVQCANDPEFCPVFPGDSRITMIEVSRPPKPVAKRELMAKLRAEAADFLAHILKIEIPEVNDRLGIPVVETAAKTAAAKNNESELEAFIRENCHHVPGSLILLGEFYDRMREWLDPDRRAFWTKQKIVRQLVQPYVKGRRMQEAGKHYLGNISWQPSQGTPTHKYIVDGEKLVLEPLGA